MTFSEWKKKNSPSQGQTETGGESFASWKANKIVNDNYIKSFVDEANDYYKSSAADYDKLTWDNAGTTLKDREKSYQNLSSKANVIGTWLESNKGKIDDESYKSLSDTLASFKKDGLSVIDQFKSYYDFTKDFYSAEEFDAYVKDYEQNKDQYKAEHDALLSFDTKLGQEHIDIKQNAVDAQEQIDTLRILQKSVSPDFWGTMNTANQTRYDEYEREIRDLMPIVNQALSMYGVSSIDELKEMLFSEREYLQNAKKAQKKAEFEAVADPKSEYYDPDFDRYSIYTGGGNEVIQYVNAGEAERKRLLKMYPHLEKVVDTLGLDYFNNKEKELFNYYYQNEQKWGADKVQEYTDALAETLNTRRGRERYYTSLKDQKFLQDLFIASSSIEGFFNDINNLLFVNEALPTSAEEVALGLIREERADKGLPWYNFATGEWRPIIINGSTTEQLAQDALSTTTRMLPSILAAVATELALPTAGEGAAVFSALMTPKKVGQAVGSLTMGLSAAGAGKQEMLRLGYSVEQANAYGVMVGAAETLMERLLGGIAPVGGDGIFSGLFGKLSSAALGKIDNALARVAITLGSHLSGNAFDEALEEGLQTLLEPWLKEIATGGIDFEDPSVDEVLYNSLLGAVSSLLFSGAEIGGTAISNAYGRGQAINAHGNEIIENNGVDPLKKLALEMTDAEANKNISRAVKRVDKKATPKSVGKLSATMEKAIRTKNKTAVESALVSKGLTAKEARIAAKYILDEEITEGQRNVLETSERYQKAIDAALSETDVATDAIVEKFKLAEARAGDKLKKTSPDDLNTDTESDIIGKGTPNEESEETDGVRIRDGGERLGGTDTSGQVLSVEGGARPYPRRRESGRIADREAARLVNEGREVSVASLGIAKGSKLHTVRLVETENETASMKKARKEAESRGLTVKFFVGGNLVIEEDTDENVGRADKDKTYFEANGYIRGNVMLVRADHHKFTADQIARHEAGHDKIAKGEIDVNAVRERLIEILDKENVDLLAENYALAYAGSGYNENQIWEECICDSLGDMNIFATNTEAAETMARAIPEIKTAIKDTSKSPTQTRGSPQVEGKASRITRERGADHLIRHFSGKINFDYEDIYLSDQELAIISSSIKTGWGKLNKIRTLGRVYTSEAYYLFVYNNDNSITIQHALDVPSNELLIDILEEELQSDRRGKKAISSIGEWVDAIRNGRGGYSIGNAMGLLYTERGDKADALDGGSSESDRRGDLESNPKDVKGKASRELDTEYLSAVERGDLETAQRMVDKAAKKAGYNEHLYHGTNADFTKFDLRKHGGRNGKGEGYGIYLAANREISAPYGKNVIDSYVKFNRLAEGRKKTLSYNEVENLVKRSCEIEAQRMVDDEEYDSVSEALKDTWVSNIVYTYGYSSIEQVYSDVANKLWEGNDNDGDLINEIMALSGAHYDYNNALDFYDNILTPVTGIDGFHYIWGNKDGSGEQNDIYLAFSSEQIKSADPVTYDDSGNVIPLSERFNPKQKDIRFSREFDFSTEEMSDEDYRNFGWVRDNDVINSGYWKTFTTNFADAVKKDYKFNKTPAGEFMIEAYNYYDPMSAADVVVFAKGTIESPIVTRIVKIKQTDQIDIDEKRSELYAAERKGIRREAGEIFVCYNQFDFIGERVDNRNSSEGIGYNNRLDAERSRGSGKAERAVRVRFDEDNQTISTTYANGDVVTEPWGHASRELDANNGRAVGVNYKLSVRDYSLQEITHIYKRGKLGPEYDVLFDRLCEYCRNAGVKFSVVPEIRNKEGNPVPGVARGNKISFSQSDFNSTNMSDKVKSDVILHEMLHTATVYAIRIYDQAKRRGETAKLPKHINNSCKEIYRVYAAISKSPRFTGEYGVKNAYEMVAELTNPVFAEKLKGTYPSVWHKLLEVICEILGINKTFTNYDKLTKAVDEILTHPDYALSSKHDSLVSKNAHYLEESEYTDLSNYSRELDVIDYMDELAEREGREIVEPKVMSDRELLVNALESIAQDHAERKKLEEYKANIDKLNAESEKLARLKAEIKELTFGKDKTKRDPQKLKELRAEATKTENRINIYDKRLLNLETASVLKDVLQREKRKAFKAAAERGLAALHRNVEGRNKTVLRHKIQRVARELEARLDRGTKEKNVKKELSPLVRSALDLSDLLFTTDDDLIVNGFGTIVTGAEQEAIDRYLELYEEYHSYDDAVTDNKELRKELRHEMNEVKKDLAGAIERERIRISEANASDTFDTIIKEYESLAKAENSYISAVFEEDKLDHIKALKEKVGDTLVKDMTLEQLEAVYKAFRIVQHSVSESNKLFGAEQSHSREELGTQLYNEIVSHGEKGKMVSLPGKAYAEFDYNNLKPIWLGERLGSPTLQRLMDAIFGGESEWAALANEAKKYKTEQKERFNFKKWDFKKTWSFKTPTGQTYELNLEQMLTIYAYAQRGEQAMNHLMKDGFVFDKLGKNLAHSSITRSFPTEKRARWSPYPERLMPSLITTISSRYGLASDWVLRHFSGSWMRSLAERVNGQLLRMKPRNIRRSRKSDSTLRNGISRKLGRLRPRPGRPTSLILSRC